MTHDIYLQRSYTLARLATKDVKSNPYVGAVVVHKNRIIGEGYHARYGSAHAEVNAIQSISPEDYPLLPQSMMYVSLEPCCHHGKTPPCVDLIIKNKIPEVHIGALDPTDKVAGKGVAKLRQHGIRVHVHNQPEAIALLRPFLSNALENRPYITLKFAQSRNFYMGIENQNHWISNSYTGIHAHKLRASNDGILVGANTVVVDNPSLTTRNYPGTSPHRIVIDRYNRIPKTASIFKTKNVVVFTEDKEANMPYHQVLNSTDSYIDHILDYCIKNKLYRLLVEGGKKTLESFVSRKLWDDAYIYRSSQDIVHEDAIKSPSICGRCIYRLPLGDNTLTYIQQS